MYRHYIRRSLFYCALALNLSFFYINAIGQNKDQPTLKQKVEIMQGRVEALKKRTSIIARDLGTAINPVLLEMQSVTKELSDIGLRLNAVKTDTSSLTPIRIDLVKISERIKPHEETLTKLRQNLQSSDTSPNSSINASNEIFLTYNPAQGRPGHQVFSDKAKLKDFYSKWKVKTLKTYLEKGRFMVYSPCDNILNLAICVPTQQYNELEITSALKTIIKDNANGQFLSSLKTKLDDLVKENSTKGTLFIDLFPLLMDAYKESPLVNPDCCPDEPKYDTLSATRAKICHALQLPGGLSVLFKTGNSIKAFSIVSFAGGLPAFDNSPDSRKIKVEPREYVTIYEKKKLNSDATPIWWLIKDEDTLRKDKTESGMFDARREFSEKFYGHQQYEAVDINSILEIRFDQEELARNVDFYGNISLAASIGDRKIEVAPYYVIGEQRRSLGVNSEPIRKIANNFIRLFIEARRAEAEFNRLRLSLIDHTEMNDKMIREILLERINFLNEYYGKVLTENSNTTDTKVYAYLPYTVRTNLEAILYYVSSSKLYNFSKRPEAYTLGEVISELAVVRGKIAAELAMANPPAFRANIQEQGFQRELIIRYETFMLTVKRIKDFMNFFNSSGEDSKRAFLNLTSISEVDFNQIYQTITTDTQVVPDNWIDFVELKENKGIARNKIEQIGKAITRMNKFSGELGQLLRDHGYNNNFLNIDFETEKNRQIKLTEDSARHNGIAFTNRRDSIVRKGKIDDKFSVANIDKLLDEDAYSLLLNYEDYKVIRDDLARKAGKELFSKLVYATIDLAAADIPDGSMLKISVMWYNTDGSTTETAEQGIELVTAKVQVKKIGWYREFAESALFVDRINENLAQQTSVSPTNFKAAAGVSMLWSYHNDHRGQKFLGKTWRWLEPSFGLNVSFLDFSNGDVFEFGAGPIMGLWQNRVFLVSGYNFNVNGESPFYMGVGFSFMNLFRTKEEKKETNE